MPPVPNGDRNQSEVVYEVPGLAPVSKRVHLNWKEDVAPLRFDKTCGLIKKQPDSQQYLLRSTQIPHINRGTDQMHLVYFAV